MVKSNAKVKQAVEKEWSRFDTLMDKILSSISLYRRIKEELLETIRENDKLREKERRKMNYEIFK